MRVFRGGGQAKDAVYLRGLGALLDYLGRGGSLEPLLVGKIGLQHLDVVRDLQSRGVLVPPPFRPATFRDRRRRIASRSWGRGAQLMDLTKLEERRTQ